MSPYYLFLTAVWSWPCLKTKAAGAMVIFCILHPQRAMTLCSLAKTRRKDQLQSGNTQHLESHC